MQLLNPHEYPSGPLNRKAVPGLRGRSPPPQAQPHPTQKERKPPTQHPRNTRYAWRPQPHHTKIRPSGPPRPSGQGRANQIPAQKQK